MTETTNRIVLNDHPLGISIASLDSGTHATYNTATQRVVDLSELEYARDSLKYFIDKTRHLDVQRWLDRWIRGNE